TRRLGRTVLHGDAEIFSLANLFRLQTFFQKLPPCLGNIAIARNPISRLQGGIDDASAFEQRRFPLRDLKERRRGVAVLLREEEETKHAKAYDDRTENENPPRLRYGNGNVQKADFVFRRFYRIRYHVHGSPLVHLLDSHILAYDRFTL